MKPTEEQLINFAVNIVKDRGLAIRIIQELPDASNHVSVDKEDFHYIRVRIACVVELQYLRKKTRQAMDTLRELIAVGFMTKESIVQAI